MENDKRDKNKNALKIASSFIFAFFAYAFFLGKFYLSLFMFYLIFLIFIVALNYIYWDDLKKMKKYYNKNPEKIYQNMAEGCWYSIKITFKYVILIFIPIFLFIFFVAWFYKNFVLT